MTNWQHFTIDALSRCRLQAYSMNKRFVVNLSAKPITARLSEAQDRFLWLTAWRYRRQLPRLVVQWAEFYCNKMKPDLSEYKPRWN